MSKIFKQQPPPNRTSLRNKVHAILPFVGFLAPIATFLLAVSNLDEIYKLGALGLIAGFSLVVCVYAYANFPATGGEDAAVQPQPLESSVNLFDEARPNFSPSMPLADAFEIAAKSLSEIVPLAACRLYLWDDASQSLELEVAEDKGSGLSPKTPAERPGLAELALHGGEIEIDEDLASEWLSAGPDELRSAAAIPLSGGGHIFAVLEIFMRTRFAASDENVRLLETIGEQLSPLMSNAVAFERSVSNALTDRLTGLPSERAFYLILESQLAECVRSGEERPLTVLTIDVRNFSSANRDLGRDAGDRILVFTADLIKDNLRKMDFLARGENDEFLIVLPTAAEATALEVLERILTAFGTRCCPLPGANDFMVRLNLGWASYWKDGDTPEQLVRSAQLRKFQSKADEPEIAAAFSEDYIN